MTGSTTLELTAADEVTIVYYNNGGTGLYGGCFEVIFSGYKVQIGEQGPQGPAGSNGNNGGVAAVGNNGSPIWSIPGWRVHLSSVIVGANVIYYTPIYISETTTYDGIGFKLQGSTLPDIVRFGIYSWSSGLPGTLLHDFGTVDCSVLGDRVQNINVTLSPGYYFIAVSRTGSGGSMNVTGADITQSEAPVSGKANSIGATKNVCLREFDTGGTFTTGGFPITPTLASGYTSMCFVYLRE